MKSKIEIINETVEYYSEDVTRRATEDYSCRYWTPDGKACAVGRCLEDPKSFRNSYVSARSLLLRGKRFDILKEEYRIPDINFWVDIQHFHDGGWNWTHFGLSDAGIIKAKRLKEKYA